MKYNHYIIGLVFVLAACTASKKDSKELLTHFKNRKEVKAIIVDDFEKWGILNPVGIVKLDSFIAVGYANDKTNISIVNLFTNQRRDIIPRGSGPGEATNVSYISGIKPNAVVTIDPNIGNYFICNVQKVMNDTTYHPLIFPMGNKQRTVVTAACETFIIGTGLYEKGKYMYHSFADSSTHYSLNHPVTPKYEDLTQEANNILYLSNVLRIKPDHKKFACTNIQCGLLDICAIENGKIERIKEIIYYYPNVHIDNTNNTTVAYSRDNTFGFMDMDVSDTNIYVLFSGRKYRDIGSDAFSSPNLLVFDWEGNPVQLYELEIPLTYMTYDEKEHAIYGIGHAPESILVKYQL